MYYWGKPQFFGVRAAAANIGSSKGNYTVEQFRKDYPQFFNAVGDFLGFHILHSASTDAPLEHSHKENLFS